MASPTSAELQTQIKDSVRIIDGFSFSTLASSIDTYSQSQEGDNYVSGAIATENMRSATSSLISNFDGLITSPILDFGKLANSLQGNVRSLLDSIDGDLFQYFIDNTLSANSRGISFGNISLPQTLAS